MKQGLDEIKQLRNLLCDHHQYHHQPRQGGHRCLLVSTGACQYLVQDRYDDPDCGDFEDKINIHGLHKKDSKRGPGTKAKGLVASNALGTVLLKLRDIPFAVQKDCL